MTNQPIVIVDYGMGNLNSIAKKVSSLGADAIISSKPKEILNAQKIILPGVGHFGKAMENIKSLNIFEALNKAILENKTPILGICLGMQLMCKKSEEGNVDGFGWIDAEVLRFNIKDKLKHKVPHTGWNQISINKTDSLLMKDISNLSEFYFVHSYYVKAIDESVILNQTEYELEFTSAIEKGNVFGTQYHPEKSHDVGAQLFKNFINL